MKRIRWKKLAIVFPIVIAITIACNQKSEPEPKLESASITQLDENTSPKIDNPLSNNQSQEKQFLDANEVEEHIKQLKSKYTVDRRHAAEALEEIGPNAKAAVPALIETLNDSNDNVRRSAIDALKKIGTDAVPALVVALRSNSGIIRASAADAIAGIGPAANAAVPALIKNLGDDDSNVRGAAKFALQRIGLEAVPALIEALKDSNRRFVRGSAAAALSWMPEAVPSLIEELNNSDSEIRYWVAGVLGKIGSEAKSAVPKLRSIAEHDIEQRVRDVARDALAKIQDE